MVSTLDSESSDPSSNLGGTFPFRRRSHVFLLKKDLRFRPRELLASCFGPNTDAPRATRCSRSQVLLLSPFAPRRRVARALASCSESGPGHPGRREVLSTRTGQGERVTEPGGVGGGATHAALPVAGHRRPQSRRQESQRPS